MKQLTRFVLATHANVMPPISESEYLITDESSGRYLAVRQTDGCQTHYLPAFLSYAVDILLNYLPGLFWSVATHAIVMPPISESE